MIYNGKHILDMSRSTYNSIEFSFLITEILILFENFIYIICSNIINIIFTDQLGLIDPFICVGCKRFAKKPHVIATCQDVACEKCLNRKLSPEGDGCCPRCVNKFVKGDLLKIKGQLATLYKKVIKLLEEQNFLDMVRQKYGAKVIRNRKPKELGFDLPPIAKE